MDYGAAYGELHRQHPGWFRGLTAVRYERELAELVAGLPRAPDRVLDFGCGKGHQYLVERLHERCGFPLPVCYDPGVAGLDEQPHGPFDLVICTDVLEHLEERDVAGTLARLHTLAAVPGSLFCAIACRPAKPKKLLPDGRGVHLTIRPPVWWQGQFARWSRRDLDVRLAFDEGAT